MLQHLLVLLAVIINVLVGCVWDRGGKFLWYGTSRGNLFSNNSSSRPLFVSVDHGCKWALVDFWVCVGSMDGTASTVADKSNLGDWQTLLHRVKVQRQIMIMINFLTSPRRDFQVLIGGGGSQRPKNLCMWLNWNFHRGGGSYKKSLPWGGMDILWNYTMLNI